MRPTVWRCRGRVHAPTARGPVVMDVALASPACRGAGAQGPYAGACGRPTGALEASPDRSDPRRRQAACQLFDPLRGPLGRVVEGGQTAWKMGRRDFGSTEGVRLGPHSAGSCARDASGRPVGVHLQPSRPCRASSRGGARRDGCPRAAESTLAQRRVRPWLEQSHARRSSTRSSLRPP